MFVFIIRFYSNRRLKTQSREHGEQVSPIRCRVMRAQRIQKPLSSLRAGFFFFIRSDFAIGLYILRVAVFTPVNKKQEGITEGKRHQPGSPATQASSNTD